VTSLATTRPQDASAVGGNDGGDLDVGDDVGDAEDLVGLVGLPADPAQGHGEQAVATPVEPIPAGLARGGLDR
jgi:hypothetical protein